MKTIKVIWSLILLFTVISCSTDDIQTEQLQNIEETKNNGSKIFGTGDFTGTLYGMPEKNPFVEYYGTTIKIAYYPTSDMQRFDIRKQFHEKYPQLLLEERSQSSYGTEIWFIDDYFYCPDPPNCNVISRGDGQANGEQDPDVDIEPDGPSVYESIIEDIRNNPSIDILDEYDPFNLSGI
ncbi:hypothetical protein [Aquimarina mytili]|uniref:Lipoprotein n=1 Tax=Aquimarina mytili TaxID=874423 RepID=A0A937D5X5_9FLAO|nr:hypothetical protein [Aquimarina mytili]MBL0683769.1 hypothetical protein [Aquimarina mytili]